MSLSCIYADDGIYTILIQIQNDDGKLVDGSFTITVLNLPPVPSITSISSLRQEGTLITAVGSATDPGANDAPTLAWTVFKGIGSTVAFASGAGANFSFTPNDNAIYRVTVTATDKDTISASVFQDITVLNLPPTPTIASISNPRQEGSAITVTGSATDPAGVNDTLSLSWAVTKGVGSTIVVASGTTAVVASGTTKSFTFTPADNDTYRVTLTAAEEDGGSASVFQDFVVANVDPTVSLSLNVASSITAGTSVVATSLASDPAGANDPLTYSWTILRNGAAFATQAGGTSYTFTPTLAGTYDIRLLVNDGDGGLVTVTRNVVVAAVTSNTPPTVAITTPIDGVFNVASTFGFAATDLDAVDQNGLFTYSIQWGDGISSTVVGPRNITVL